MQAFHYEKVHDVQAALTSAANPHAKFVAGGTTLIDLMKLNVERPTTLVDINLLALDKIEKMPGGGLRIGAMVRNSDLAHDAGVQSDYPVLSQALLSGASPQLRNMATTGEICSSARGATTFATLRTPAINATPVPDARPWTDTTASMRFSARVNTVSPPILLTWRSR